MKGLIRTFLVAIAFWAFAVVGSFTIFVAIAIHQFALIHLAILAAIFFRMWNQKFLLLGSLIALMLVLIATLTWWQQNEFPSMVRLSCEEIDRIEPRCFDPELKLYRDPQLPLPLGHAATELIAPVVTQARLLMIRNFERVGTEYHGPYLRRSEAIDLLFDYGDLLKELPEARAIERLEARFGLSPTETADRLAVELYPPVARHNSQPQLGTPIVELQLEPYSGWRELIRSGLMDALFEAVHENFHVIGLFNPSKEVDDLSLSYGTILLLDVEKGILLDVFREPWPKDIGFPGIVSRPTIDHAE